MRKYLFSLMLATALLLAGISASASDGIVIPTAEELLQAIPSEVQQQARTGSTELPPVQSDRFSLYWGENDGANYILQILFPKDGYSFSPYGVFDFAANKWRIPCDYHQIVMLPEQRYLLGREDGEKWVYYEAAADGTIRPDPLPFDGQVIGVDEEGYVTVCRQVIVPTSNPMYAEQENAEYSLMALLDNHYKMVMDYVYENNYADPISFTNGVAIIQRGSTKQEHAGHRQVILSGSTYGLMNRNGEWIGEQDYTSMFHISANDRIFAYRGETLYLVTEEGLEIPLAMESSEIKEGCGDWARDAIEQAKARSLVPEKIQGYYTLDIFREEFCSLLMNAYRAAGREVPALDSAPVFTDCDLVDVRIAAALNIVSGYEDNSFRPRNRITREEAAAILSRFISLFREIDETVSAPYQDDSSIGNWAKPQVYAVRNAGIMSGTENGVFSPKGTYTIEQAISVVNRLYDLMNSK